MTGRRHAVIVLATRSVRRPRIVEHASGGGNARRRLRSLSLRILPERNRHVGAKAEAADVWSGREQIGHRCAHWTSHRLSAPKRERTRSTRRQTRSRRAEEGADERCSSSRLFTSSNREVICQGAVRAFSGAGGSDVATRRTHMHPPRSLVKQICRWDESAVILA